MDIAYSKNNVPIRLTTERWLHIVENHDEVAGYYDEVLQAIEDPDYIIEGYKGSLIALKKFGEEKILQIVYREVSAADGFIITAFFTKKLKLEDEVIIWQGQA